MTDVIGGVQDDQIYVLERVELQSNKVTVACAAERCVPVCVMNPTDQDIILYSGTRIAGG